tara:strand:- start:896 stop:2362 length:1467 start_codon:yes stop_codon:yes gene_type:complete
MKKLKVKFSKISAGRPVAILHKNFAEKASIHINDRIFIEKKRKKIVAIVDVATGIVKENEIALSTEVIKFMKLKEGSLIEIEEATKPSSLYYIYKKLSCKPLNKKEIYDIIEDIVKNELTEAEIAYFVAAVYKCGMPMNEIVHMTKAIVNTGSKLNLKGRIIDKHSVGGIPGRTTPIIISICASAGLLIPKTSSRAITSASGTADAMEVLCKIDFSKKQIKKILAKTNACIVWGGSLNIAPADDKLIQIERLINLDPEAQLLASIIAKKAAVNAKYVLIDIPYGKNAKVTKKQALELEKKFKQLGKYFNMKIKCSLEETKEPLGSAIGPSLEIQEAVKVLTRESPCHKLEKKSLRLAGELLELSGKTKKGKGYEKAKQILDSGQAYKKFIQIIRAQKGRIKKIKKAKYSQDINSHKNGKISEIKIKQLNNLARIAGCPLDKSAGVYLHKHLNDNVKKYETLLTIYSESKAELREAVKFYEKTKLIKFK